MLKEESIQIIIEENEVYCVMCERKKKKKWRTSYVATVDLLYENNIWNMWKLGGGGKEKKENGNWKKKLKKKTLFIFKMCNVASNVCITLYIIFI